MNLDLFSVIAGPHEEIPSCASTVQYTELTLLMQHFKRRKIEPMRNIPAPSDCSFCFEQAQFLLCLIFTGTPRWKMRVIAEGQN
jgi:hypothetical protein